MSPETIVVNLILLNGGKLTGRTRLQKQAYLLHCCGAELNELDFIYHYYGPYSFELADGCVNAKVEERITMEERHDQYGGRYRTPYTVFEATGTQQPTGIGELSSRKSKAVVDRTNQASSIALELAATAAFLQRQGVYDGRVMEELKLRKSRKATAENLQEAQQLLEALGLDALGEVVD